MLGGRRRAGADDLALQPDRVPEVWAVAESLGEKAAGFFDLLRRRAEGFPLNPRRSLELRERLDAAGGEDPASPRVARA